MTIPHPLERRPEAPALRTETFALRLLAPAFLGNATQEAQWRTPPLKALLRAWWRLVSAGELLRAGVPGDHLHEHVREREGELFGQAFEAKSGQSRVRLRLSSWAPGKPWNAGRGPKVPGNPPFDAFVYTAFGPLAMKNSTPRTDLEAGSAVKLTVTAPDADWPQLEQALGLIHLFGTIGSRNRNGWGSLALDPAPATDLSQVTRDWKACLGLPWPHALGQGLRWRSRKTFGDWGQAMTEAARLRKQLNLAVVNTVGSPSERHLLSLPVTKNMLDDKNERWASQLRFKLCAGDRDARQLRLHAFQLPCAFPFPLPGVDPVAVWEKVHRAMTVNGMEIEQ